MAFKSDLITGEKGEEAVREFLKRLQGVKEVLDVRGDSEFQKLDIDFVCMEEKGGFTTVEVKTDTLAHKTGNLAYEVYSSKTYKTQGCFEKTQAKYIFYYLLETEELYIMKTEELRKYVERYFKGMTMIPMGDDALGYLIKLRKLVYDGIAVKTS